MINLDKENKKAFIAISCIFLIMFVMNKCDNQNKIDDVVNKVLSSLSDEAPFKLIKRTFPENELLLTGRIGDFLNCLKRKRDISTRRINGKGNISENVLIVDDLFHIRVGSVAGEVFSFSIQVVDERGTAKEFSKVYAVNCEISLLDAD